MAQGHRAVTMRPVGTDWRGSALQPTLICEATQGCGLLKGHHYSISADMQPCCHRPLQLALHLLSTPGLPSHQCQAAQQCGAVCRATALSAYLASHAAATHPSNTQPVGLNHPTHLCSGAGCLAVYRPSQGDIQIQIQTDLPVRSMSGLEARPIICSRSVRG